MRCKLFKHYDELHKVIFRENKGTVVKLKKGLSTRDTLISGSILLMVIVVWWDWDVLIKYFSDSLLLSRSLTL